MDSAIDISSTSVIKYIDRNRVEIGGHLYKRLKTKDGKYSTSYRRRYMQVWRKASKVKSVSL